MEQIKHQGKIVKINENQIEVEILSKSACQDCEAKASCGLAECLRKKVEITSAEAKNFRIGEEVWVALDARAGLYAVFFAYILPLIVVLIGLLTALLIGYSEQIAGISSIILLIPYYFGLFLCHKRKPKQMQFTISKK